MTSIPPEAGAPILLLSISPHEGTSMRRRSLCQNLAAVASNTSTSSRPWRKHIQLKCRMTMESSMIEIRSRSLLATSTTVERGWSSMVSLRNAVAGITSPNAEGLTNRLIERSTRFLRVAAISTWKRSCPGVENVTDHVATPGVTTAIASTGNRLPISVVEVLLGPRGQLCVYPSCDLSLYLPSSPIWSLVLQAPHSLHAESCV